MSPSQYAPANDTGSVYLWLGLAQLVKNIALILAICISIHACCTRSFLQPFFCEITREFVKFATVKWKH
jgi:hypothetical protein